MSGELRRWLLGRLPLVAVAAAVLAALLLVADVQSEGGRLGRLNVWIFALTALALIALLIAIGSQVLRLYRQVRSGEPGARMARRLVLVMLTLALPPVLIVYFFSLEFLNTTISGWFDIETESALENSLEIGQWYLEQNVLEAQDHTQRLAAELTAIDDTAWFETLLDRLAGRGPIELAVLDDSGEAAVSASLSADLKIDRPDNFALLQARESGSYTAAEPDAAGGLKIRALRQLDERRGGGRPPRLVQAIYPLPSELTGRMSRIEQVYYRQKTNDYLREALTRAFILILTLVLVLTVLLAMLLGIGAAKRLVKPLTDLASAAGDIAEGRFSRRVEITGRDELAFLGRAFNRMGADLAAGRAALEAQRQNLETLLARLSAGVIAIDAAGRLTLSNASAATILGCDLKPHRDHPLAGLAATEPPLEPLITAIADHLDPPREWRSEVVIKRPGQKPLALVVRGAPLPTAAAGHVIVFDDVTVLTEAQREAAWAEVARRLAHEVKNPLTPIRLAAERLAMKLQGLLPDNERGVLDKTTRTIITQVDALRAMVNTFGDYAQAGKIEPQAVRLDEIAASVQALYEGGGALAVTLDQPAAPAPYHGDPVRLRQMLLNLLQNAKEAGAAHVQIALSRKAQSYRLVVSDDGPGFPAAALERIFEPYVTTKARGSGLGLAIVRRIVEEHGGRVSVENDGGARVLIELPESISMQRAAG